MNFSPLFELLAKHRKFINDLMVEGLIMGSVYIIDSFFYSILRYNLPHLSLLLFVIGFLLARYIIRRLKKQKLFGGYANYGLVYNLVLAIGIWLIYLLNIRIPKFGNH